MARRRSPDQTDTDRHLWEVARARITPLPSPSRPQPSPPSPPVPPPAPVPPVSVPVPASSAAPRAREVDGATLRRLRAGKLPVEGTLDLHGLTQAKAHTALNTFVQRHYNRGGRCLLLITGKGQRGAAEAEDDTQRGVLRRLVPLWLEEEPLRSCLLTTATARPTHGGAGALYLLLRRKR